MTSSFGSTFRVTDPLCGEFTGHRWIPLIKGQWRGALMVSLICAWTNGWVNNRDVGDLRCHRPHFDVTLLNEASKIPSLLKRTWSKHPIKKPHWNGNDVILTKFSPLPLPEVVNISLQAVTEVSSRRRHNDEFKIRFRCQPPLSSLSRAQYCVISKRIITRRGVHFTTVD